MVRDKRIELARSDHAKYPVTRVRKAFQASSIAEPFRAEVCRTLLVEAGGRNNRACRAIGLGPWHVTSEEERSDRQSILITTFSSSLHFIENYVTGRQILER